MTILFDVTRTVKTTRKPFGIGVGRPARPERPAPYTMADLAWAAANLNANAREYEVVDLTPEGWDRAGAAALAQARLDAGFPPF